MIPVFEPQIGKEETAAVVAALARGEISGSFGEAITQFESQFAEYCGCRHGVATSSGTTALHLAAAVLDLGPRDEVLVSASTNIASALCAHHLGATPIPVDSENTTWNLDLDQIESLVTPRTKAIIPVHLFGHPVDMDRLMAIARRHGLAVIEDCAEAHGALCHGHKVGSFGDLACFSFYANKVLTTGEGGMVLTNDDGLAERLRLLRNLAFRQPRFWHLEAGYNFRMTGMQAALGLVQVGRAEAIIAEKRRVAAGYHRHLSGVLGLQLPAEMRWARNVYWMYGITVQPEFGLTRDELAAQLREDGIDTRTFFCPLDQQPCLRKPDDRPLVPCPVADRLWKTGLYLPSSTNLSESTIAWICQRIAVASRRAAGEPTTPLRESRFAA
jgi:perosamine synthetase